MSIDECFPKKKKPIIVYISVYGNGPGYNPTLPPLVPSCIMSDILAREKPAVDSDPYPPSTAVLPPQTPSQGSRHSPGLEIPEPTDGYFGYSEEKSLRHVRQ